MSTNNPDAVLGAASREVNRQNDPGGDFTSADAGAAAVPSRRRGRPRAEGAGQVVSCRLPAPELQAFDALCIELGATSRSDGMRSIVRMAAGFLEFSQADAGRLDDIRHELHRIGVNVNQIALAANRGRAPMVRAQWSAIDELRRTLPVLRTTVAEVTLERRRRGTALFRQFAAGEAGSNG